MARIMVDGMNVIGSRPTGWWRDRPAASRTLLGRLQKLAAASGDEVTLVLDGRPLPGLPEGEHGGVRLLYPRRRGPDAADDRIVATLATDPDPGSVRVFTSDRDLRRQVQSLGAAVEGAGALLSLLDRLSG